MRRPALAATLVGGLLSGSAATAAGDVLNISASIWAMLAQPEQDYLKKLYLVSVAESSRYGTIIDVQGIDESSPGSNSGSELGARVGSAIYTNNNTKNYSSSANAGAALLGAVIGAALNTPAVNQFHFRYTIRDGAGGVAQFDQLTREPFHQPIGMCVLLPSVSVVSSAFCDVDVATFRRTYLSVQAPPSAAWLIPAGVQAAPKVGEFAPPGSDDLVKCKIGMSGVISVSRQRCNEAQGEIKQ